jgi:hypothetical protein
MNQKNVGMGAGAGQKKAGADLKDRCPEGAAAKRASLDEVT